MLKSLLINMVLVVFVHVLLQVFLFVLCTCSSASASSHPHHSSLSYCSVPRHTFLLKPLLLYGAYAWLGSVQTEKAPDSLYSWSDIVMLVLLLKQHTVAPESSFQQRLHLIQAVRSRGLEQDSHPSSCNIFIRRIFWEEDYQGKKKSEQFLSNKCRRVNN